MGKRCPRVGFMLALAVLVTSVWGAESPTIEVAPSSVQYVAGASPPEILVVMRNPTTLPLHDINITAFPNAYARTKIDPTTQSVVIKPRGDVFWQITLPTTMPAEISDALRLRVTYETGAGETLIDHVLDTSVDVKLAKTISPSDVADLKLLSDIDDLHGGEPFSLVLSVQNKLLVPVTVGSIQLNDVAFATFPKASAVKTIPAGHMALISLSGTVNDVIAPGKRTLTLPVEMRWGPPGTGMDTSVAVSHDFTLSVLGTSEILTTLGVPSLLVLPGYLIVICALSIMALGQKDRAELPLWKSITKPGTLIIALTCSFIMIGAYKHYSGHDISVAYGLNDVMWIWICSAGIGVVFGALVQLVQWLLRLWDKHLKASADKIVALAKYQSVDRPLDLLARLSRNDGAVRLPFMVPQDAGGLRYFRLPEKFGEAGQCWVAPSIVVRGPFGNETGKELERALNASGDVSPTGVARIIDEGANKYHWATQWKSDQRPRPINERDFRREGDGFIVEMDPE